MGIPFLILLAIVWSLFGLWCFMHGTKFGLLLVVLIFVALLVLSMFPTQVQKYFEFVNDAAGLFTGSDIGVINTEPANLVAILLVGALILAALLGFIKTFRGRHSIGGFFLGLLSGYIFTAYLLAALMPRLAFLPLPIKISGLTATQLSAAVSAPPEQGLLAELNTWLASATKLSCSSEAIIILIVGFILLVILAGGRGRKQE